MQGNLFRTVKVIQIILVPRSAFHLSTARNGSVTSPLIFWDKSSTYRRSGQTNTTMQMLEKTHRIKPPHRNNSSRHMHHVKLGHVHHTTWNWHPKSYDNRQA